jgi:hypothetical protein
MLRAVARIDESYRLIDEAPAAEIASGSGVARSLDVTPVCVAS